jgi:hypothetical protein
MKFFKTILFFIFTIIIFAQPYVFKVDSPYSEKTTLIQLSYNLVSAQEEDEGPGFISRTLTREKNNLLFAPRLLGAAAKGDGAGALKLVAEQSGVFGGALDSVVGGAISFAIKFVSVQIGLFSSVLLFITSWVLSLASTFLNAGIEFSTIGISNILGHNSKTAIAIKETWEIFRDLANIGLVFIMLYIAINTIIGAGSFQTKKLLGKTILVAILINFSYLATAIVIDISNIMAISIHESVEKKIKNSGAEHLGDFIRKESKQDRIKQALPTSDPSRGSNQAPNSIMNSMVANILLVVLNVVMIIVFLIAAIMLITRVIILMFVLVLAPIGFVSSILPNTGKMAKEWWSTLISNAFFLPVFLLFILVAVEIIGSGGLDSLEKIATNAAGSGGGGFGAQQTQSLLAAIKTVMGPLVQYSIVIGLFIAALVVSRKMSMGGGGIASKVSGSITTSIGKGAIGAGAFAGRNTIGYGADKLANSEGMKRFANKYRSFGGTQVLKGVRGVAGSSFDARGSRAFKGVASATGVGNDFGKAGGGGGYRKALDTRSNDRAKFNKEAFDYEISDSEAVTEGLVDGEMATLATANKQLQNHQERKKNGGAFSPETEKKLIANAKAAQDQLESAVKNASKNGGKMVDAKNLKNSKLDFWQGGRNKKASEKIMKELKKSADDKRFDKLESLIKDSAKDD